jgi:hypothetical protein
VDIKERMQQRAIAALMEHRHPRDAAKAIGVSLSTLRRNMALPEFRAKLAENGAIALEEARRVLQVGAADAAGALVEFARGKKSANASTQIRACNAVLNHVVRLVEVCDLAVRVAELEATIGKPPPVPGGRTALAPDEDERDPEPGS